MNGASCGAARACAGCGRPLSWCNTGTRCQGCGGSDEPGSPTLLRALIVERHWQRFSAFEAQFKRAAGVLAERDGDPELAKLTVSSRQWERWYSGNVKTEPYPDACRVLEHMFGYPIGELLAADTRQNASRPAVPWGTALEGATLEGAALASAVPGGAALGEAGLDGARRDPVPGVPDISWIARITPFLNELRLLSEGQLSSACERERLYDHLVELLSRWAGTMKRRDFVGVLGLAASSVAAVPFLDSAKVERLARVVAVPTRVDETVIDHIEAVLWHAARQDDMLGPQAALYTVLSQRNVILWILDDCPEALRPRLLSALATASRQAGWLSFDAEDHQGAWFYFEKARAAAHEARDSALAGYVLCNMSRLATWQGTPRVGIDHAVAAQGWVSQTDDKLLQAHAHQVAALAYAADGQTVAFRELEKAEALIGAASAATRSLTYFNGSAQIASDWGECHLALDDAARAARATSQALEHYDPAFVRLRALSMLDLARAHLRADEIAEAASVAATAADMSTQNRSPRLAAQVRESLDQFRPWSDAKSVRELTDKCASLGILR